MTALAERAELLCPGCSYDLRGIQSDRCPECGLAIDRSHLGRSRLPWLNRRQLGAFTGFVRTVMLVSFKPSRLTGEISAPGSLDEAMKFHRLVALLAFIPLAMVAMPVLWRGLYSTSAGPWVWHDLLGSILQLLGILVALGCLYLYLLAMTGVASYFFHPASRSIIAQNRSIALSYYSGAPLAFTPITVATLLLAAGAVRILGQIPLLLLELIALVAFAPLGIQLFLIVLTPGKLLVAATGCTQTWKWIFTLLLILLRVALAILVLGLIPLLYVAATLMILSLR